jgi:hypothetical protein
MTPKDLKNLANQRDEVAQQETGNVDLSEESHERPAKANRIRTSKTEIPDGFQWSPWDTPVKIRRGYETGTVKIRMREKVRMREFYRFSGLFHPGQIAPGEFSR